MTRSPIRHLLRETSATVQKVHRHSPSLSLPNITLIGNPYEAIGRSQHIRTIWRALNAVGVRAGLYDVYSKIPEPAVFAEFGSAQVAKIGGGIRIFSLNGDEIQEALQLIEARQNDFFQRGYNVVAPVWELPRYPDEWARQLNRFNEIWAPTAFVETAIRNAVSVPVYRLPNACEPHITSDLERSHFGIPQTAFAILYFFDLRSWVARKNPWAAIEAFRRLTVARPKAQVHLVLKLNCSAFEPDIVIRLTERVAPFRDRVSIIDSTLTDNEVKNLVRCCDCFLSLHRSEGFGRGPAEAMFFGKPVIATGWSGNTDYMNSQNSFPVKYTLRAVMEGEYPQHEDQVWADADISEASEILASIVDNPNIGLAVGKRARDYMRQYFSDDVIGAIYKKRLSAIAAGLSPLQRALSVIALIRGAKRSLVGWKQSAIGYPLGIVWRTFRSRSLEPLREWRAVRAIAKSGLFERTWYLSRYPDVAAMGVDPVRHYVLFGAKEGRDPSPSFSTLEYLWNNRDVAAAGVNPLLHFARYGAKEGRTREAAAHHEYVPLLRAKSPEQRKAKIICFYLPQFHAIPENDVWWGEGFTDWSNVRSAQPRIRGHYQPRIPGELEYYNLLEPEVQRRQVELAKLYGIAGFCFYVYWFKGTRLLERPIENYLADQSLDLPFCLCWANENWTRRWDGNDDEILIAQHHSDADDIAFIQHIACYFGDPRYIRVHGKPLLILYRPDLLPSPKSTATRWRDWCRRNDIGEIYLAYTQSFIKADPSRFGFDAAIEFPPNLAPVPNIADKFGPQSGDQPAVICEWRRLFEQSEHYEQPEYTLFRGVCPSWDNTARRRNGGGTIFINNSPAMYRDWLRNAIRDTRRRFADPDECLVFVNAWNEWGEGAYLEPDERYGYAYLQATRDAIVEQTS